MIFNDENAGEDFESTAMRFEKELQETKHMLVVEKSLRVAAEERFLEEHRITAKLEQTANAKIEVSLTFTLRSISFDNCT